MNIFIKTRQSYPIDGFEVPGFNVTGGYVIKELLMKSGKNKRMLTFYTFKLAGILYNHRFAQSLKSLEKLAFGIKY